MVVPDREPVRDRGGETAEVVADALARRLDSGNSSSTTSNIKERSRTVRPCDRARTARGWIHVAPDRR